MNERQVLHDLAASLDPQAVMKKHGISAEQMRALIQRASEFLPAPAPAPAAEPVFVINVDGAARGNPGPAGAGVMIRCDGRMVEGQAQYLGPNLTNNQAEYNALIIGLTRAAELGAERVEVLSDSELMVRQVRGEYRVKNPGLAGLYEQACRLAVKFKSFKIDHVPREKNSDADRLANRAIDEFENDDGQE